MTSRVIYGEEERLLPWAVDKIGVAFRDDARTMGLERDGNIVSVVVFDCFSLCDCNMHIASDGSRQWMNKEYLVKGFAYPFVQMGLRRVTGLVPANNQDALKFNRNLGFKFEGLCKDATPDGDIVVMGMTRDNCRFIPKGNPNEPV